MEKGRSSGIGGMPPPPLPARFGSVGSSFGVRSGESSHSAAPAAMPESGWFGQGFSFGAGQSSNDLGRMPDCPQRNVGHRRVQSLGLPDMVGNGSSFGIAGTPSNGRAFSEEDEIEEDLISMYMDLDKLNSSFDFESPSLEVGEGSVEAKPQAPSPKETVSACPSDEPVVRHGQSFPAGGEKPKVWHRQSLSLDGSILIKPEVPFTPEPDSKKALSAAKLADLALIDPKRAKRIWANRQSAARSKERKMRYILELEQKVQALQTETTTMTAQLTMLQSDTGCLTTENSELKVQLQSIEQQVNLQDALNDALRDEVHRLKVATGVLSPNGEYIANYGTGFGASQQFYPYNNAVHTLITAQQLQQLQIHPPQQQQHNQVQHQPPNDMQYEGPSPPNNEEPDVYSSSNE